MAYNDESELITQIRRLISEPIALVHSDTDITSYIDRAAEEIATRGLLFEETTAATTLADDIYTFTYAAITEGGAAMSDAVKVDYVLYWGAKDPSTGFSATSLKALVKIHPRQVGHGTDTTATGPPREWWAQDETLYIWPPSSSSEAGHFIQVLYHKKPNTYNDGTDIPPYLRELVIWYSTAKCFEREGKYAQHEQYMSIFNSFVDYFSADRALAKLPDSKDMMTTPDRTQFVE